MYVTASYETVSVTLTPAVFPSRPRFRVTVRSELQPPHTGEAKSYERALRAAVRDIPVGDAFHAWRAFTAAMKLMVSQRNRRAHPDLGRTVIAKPHD